MKCGDLREIADSYLGDELLIETNHDVIRHLESCADCRRELSARRDLREKLRRAFINSPGVQMRDEFANQLLAQLRSYANQKRFLGGYSERNLWTALAAACLVIAGVFILRTNWQSSSQTTAVSTDPVQTAEVARLSGIAAGDHQNCAVRFRLPQSPIELAEAGRKYDAVYSNLTNAVLSGQNQVAKEIQFVKAHSCVFDEQRFGHVILKHQERLVSVLVTIISNPRTQRKESSTEASKIVVACQQSGDYQVSCFETGRHVVFIVSDLTNGANLSIAQALAPSIDNHITQVEGATSNINAFSLNALRSER